MKTFFDFLIVVVVIAVAVAIPVGYIMNIVDLVSNTAIANGELIARALGLVLVPLGVFMGIFF